MFNRPAPKKATARWNGDRAKQAARSNEYRKFRAGQEANLGVLLGELPGTIAYEPANSNAWRVQRY